MIMSFRLGTNDIAKARAFYDATFVALGGSPSVAPPTAPMALYRQAGAPVLIIGPAADGEPATHANGGTILLVAPDDDSVDAWHAAGLANGGTDAGAPGPRARVKDRRGAYLRDPDGNKLGCYAGSLFG